MKNYIFDLYGTLVDIHTDEGKEELWEKLALFYGYYNARYEARELEKRFRELISNKEQSRKEEIEKKDAIQKQDDVHEAHPEIHIEDVFAALYREKGVEPDEALSVHTGQFFRVLSTEYVRLYEGVAELLQALKDQGKKVYLLSNAQRIFTEYEMHTLDIAKYFDDIFISSVCGVKKPDERFYQMLLDKHQLDPKESIMIGNDAVSDIAGAKAVGLSTLYIHSNISPKLKTHVKKDENGNRVEVEELPDADYVLLHMDLKEVKRILLEL